jgi:serine protease Do
MQARVFAVISAISVILPLSASGQDRPPDQFRRFPDLMMLAGRGAEIGVQITDGKDGGVVIEEVRPDSPAEKAGLKRSDVVVEFDGERVRSARQFGRLVQETPPGRTVKATIMRGGQKKDVQITPQEGRGVLGGRGTIDGDLLRDPQRELERMRDRLPPGFNLRFDMPDILSGRRLGATVEELTGQLADYFGVKDGVLVSSVTDGSAASRAGLKAGDVITSVDGQSIRSRDDLVRALRDGRDEEMKIGVVREKKEMSLTAKPDAPPRRSRGVRL